MEKLPKAARNDPDVKAIADLACHRTYNIVHLIYQSKAFEGHSKDYEFGLDAMREHWQSGLDDIRRTLRRLEPAGAGTGLRHARRPSRTSRLTRITREDSHVEG